MLPPFTGDDPMAWAADRVTASLRLRAVRIAALEAQAEADAKLLRDLRALLPFAARKLPAEVLECFSQDQQLIAPYPLPWQFYPKGWRRSFQRRYASWSPMSPPRRPR